ncbi:MAG: hypothetical protein ACQ5SW_10490 [Sphaerochaetaceae bacterium]
MLSSCSSLETTAPVIEPPSFEMVRPARPVLEQVEIPQGTVIPDSLLHNYNTLAVYALALEEYAWGGQTFGGLEKYVTDIAGICNQQ